MASDFSKMVYNEVKANVEASLGDKNLTSKEMRVLMDRIMPQVAKSFIALLASVSAHQEAEAQRIRAELEKSSAPAETQAETPAETHTETPAVAQASAPEKACL